MKLKTMVDLPDPVDEAEYTILLETYVTAKFNFEGGHGDTFRTYVAMEDAWKRLSNFMRDHLILGANVDH